MPLSQYQVETWLQMEDPRRGVPAVGSNTWIEDYWEDISAVDYSNNTDDHHFTSLLQCLSEPPPNQSQNYNNNYRQPLKQPSWHATPVCEWDGNDILEWMSDIGTNVLRILCSKLAGEKLCKLSGRSLMLLSEKEFLDVDKEYGSILYKELQKLLSSQGNENEGRTYTDLTASIKINSPDHSLSEMPTVNSDETVFKKPNYRPPFKQSVGSKDVTMKYESEEKPLKRRGRPKILKRKKKPEKKLGRLWEFIRDLLKNREHCPKYIAWENHDEGTFRFVQSDKVAKLWGMKKDNPAMNYEKLSRAMRYYYKSKVLLPVIGRRLVYKFGPAAEDWRVDNPNFKD